MSDRLAAEYDAERPRLVRVAYAILGSHAEAEDVVADCWLRLVAADEREPVRDVAAWATVTVARAALEYSGRRARAGRRTSGRGCPSRWWRTSRTSSTGSAWTTRCATRCWSPSSG